MIMKQVPAANNDNKTNDNDQMKPIAISTPKTVKIGPTTSRLNISPLPSKTINNTNNTTKSNNTFTPKSILSNKDESKKKSVKIMAPSDRERENVSHIANTKGGRSPMKSSLVSSNKSKVTISEPVVVVQSTTTTSTKSTTNSTTSSNPFATLLG